MRLRGRYSAFVKWLKALLPLAALGLISTIFLIDDDEIEFDLPPIGSLPESGRVTQSVLNADSSGRTGAGDPYRLLADTLQQVPDGFLLTNPRLYLDRESHGRITLTALAGTYNSDVATVDLTGNVSVEDSSGDTRLQADDLRLGLDTGSLSIVDPLRLTFPGGYLTANSARRVGNPPLDDTIWFEGDVRLLVEGTPPHSEN